MTRVIFFLAIGCCLSLTTTLYAQMVAVPMSIATPYGNVKSYYYVPSPARNNFYGQLNPSVKYKFTIVRKNDSTFSVRARIDVADTKHNAITIKKNKYKQRLFPSDTKFISRTTAGGELLRGVPTDSCWLFKSYTGKINAYSFLAEKGLKFAIAIQDGDGGDIVALTADNLAMIVGIDDPEINRMIETKKFTKAILTYNKKVTPQ